MRQLWRDRQQLASESRHESCPQVNGNPTPKLLEVVARQRGWVGSNIDDKPELVTTNLEGGVEWAIHSAAVPLVIFLMRIFMPIATHFFEFSRIVPVQPRNFLTTSSAFWFFSGVDVMKDRPSERPEHGTPPRCSTHPLG
jgi:hypothetical protein